MVGLDSVVDTVQRSHHDIRSNYISLSNDWSVHNFSSKDALSPSVLCRTLRCGLPANMVLQKKPTRLANNNPKEIFLLVHIENPAL